MTVFSAIHTPVKLRPLLYSLSGVGRSKLDKYRPEIEALLANGSIQKFIAQHYEVTDANLSRWLKRHNLQGDYTAQD